jgi:predicted GNAT family acetyltransferase
VQELIEDMTDPGQKLDEALEETFPASDAPANTVETGIRVGEAEAAVRDNRGAARFEVAVDGEVAFLQYERRPDAIVLVHTEVPPAFRRRGVASMLAKSALEAARAQGLRVIARCAFVRAYLQKHPELV